MDAIDLKALRLLQRDGRATWAAVAGELQMTAPAAADRVRHLEEAGVIKGYAALLDAAAVGLTFTAFVAVTLERPVHRAAFLKRVARTPEILECHHVAGDADYLLKVRCRSTSDFERVLTDELKGVAGVSHTRTTVVLSTEKDTVQVPLGAAAK